MRLRWFLKHLILVTSLAPSLIVEAPYYFCLSWYHRFRGRHSAVRAFRGIRFPVYDLRIRMLRRMYMGLYSYLLIRQVRKLLRNGDIFIDVGANVGYVTAHALSALGKRGKVYAFEPVKKYADELRVMERLNRGRTVRVEECAVGDRNGWATINLCTHKDNIGMSSILPLVSGHGGTFEARLIRLDDYLEANGIGPVRLVKIDVEGYEYPVLKGLRNCLGRDRPAVICEIVPSFLAALGYGVLDIERYMTGNAYCSYRFDCRTPKRVALNQIRSQTNVLFLPHHPSVLSPKRPPG